MAAGLGFKTFATGEVLTAADTNGYLMQGVLVFASAAARDAAITSPQEGQCCYLKDTDAVLTYSGAAWVGFDDSNAIQNSIVDAKGDLISATADNTPARIAVGTNGQTLVADSTASTGLKWATPSTGALTLISTTTLSAVSSQIISSCFSSTYDNYLMTMTLSSMSFAGDTNITLKLRTGSSVSCWQCSQILQNGATLTASTTADALINQAGLTYASMSSANLVIQAPNLAQHSYVQSNWAWTAYFNTHRTGQSKSNWIDTTQYTGLEVLSSSGTITGTISIYGMSK
jgi:hypothetical protein